MIWIVGLAAFAGGVALGYALSRRHHRRRLEELEDKYNRIVPQPHPRASQAQPAGYGISRVAGSQMKHRRGRMQP